MATTNATGSTTSTSSFYQSLIDSVNGTKTSSTSATGSISETENRFLKLLTTQLKNQDPLNPMDNAQITSQIAQISTVSGIEKLNASLKTILEDSQDNQTTLAASLVGQGVMVPGTALTLTENGGVGAFELDGAADKVTVTIKDSNGLAVRTLSLGDLDSGLHDFAWDGKADDGSQAATGNYSVSIAATKGSDKVTTTGLSLGTVRSVISSGTGYTLDVGSLGTFTLDDVRQIF